jgi:hypothetical protein
VIFGGEIMGVVTAAEAEVEMLGLMMAGRHLCDLGGASDREEARGPAH